MSGRAGAVGLLKQWRREPERLAFINPGRASLARFAAAAAPAEQRRDFFNSPIALNTTEYYAANGPETETNPPGLPS